MFENWLNRHINTLVLVLLGVSLVVYIVGVSLAGYIDFSRLGEGIDIPLAGNFGDFLGGIIGSMTLLYVVLTYRQQRRVSDFEVASLRFQSFERSLEHLNTQLIIFLDNNLINIEVHGEVNLNHGSYLIEPSPQEIKHIFSRAEKKLTTLAINTSELMRVYTTAVNNLQNDDQMFRDLLFERFVRSNTFLIMNLRSISSRTYIGLESNEYSFFNACIDQMSNVSLRDLR